MKSINVCLMNDSFPPIIDGVANAVLNYALNIEQNWGHAFAVTPSYPGADDSGWPFPVVRYPSIDIRNLTTGYMLGIPFSPELSGQMRQQKVDVIHAHCPMMSALLARAVHKRTNAPMIMTYHTKYDIDIANVIKSKPLQQSSIKSIVTNINSFDEVWAVSDGAGRNLQSLGYQGDYIVMPNGVDLPRGKASEEEVAEVTAEYDLPAGVPVFLFVGRLMWYKGLQIILDALRMLQDQGADFRMVIVGDGGDGDEIRFYAQKAGLDGKVFFTGVVTDRSRIRAWYTRADLFLFPSTFDSNGLVVREAAACDLATVLIKDSCASEGVRDNQNAFLIEENAPAMAELLFRLLQNPEHMRQVGIHAGEQLYMSWKDAVANAVRRYHEVLELYKSGAYKDKSTFADNLLATNGDLMFTIEKLSRTFNLRKSNSESYRRNRENSRKITPKKKTK